MIASPRRISAMGTSGDAGDEDEDDRDNGEDGGYIKVHSLSWVCRYLITQDH
jgi:hypothetical protein